jgi:hypothetical protein
MLETNMKKQATMIATGVLLALAMTAPSFAAKSTANHAAQREKPASAYSGYYDSAVPEGNYTNYAPSYSTGGSFNSGSMGGVGR